MAEERQVTEEHEVEIMVDLETMDVGPNAAIIQIGAIAFHDNVMLQKFFLNVDLQSAMDTGGTVSGSTIKWWIEQSEKARKSLSGEAYDLRYALINFAKWLATYDVKAVWSNGANFDVVILRSAYERLGLTCPWPFWKDRCFRTMRDSFDRISDIEYPEDLIPHKADDDAVRQTIYLITLRDRLETHLATTKSVSDGVIKEDRH